MKGDFTRDTFDPAKLFSRVLAQQGRVTLDADGNEQTAILLHYLRTLARDLIGPYAAPADHAGFELASGVPFFNDLLIGSGRYYVDGILVENFDRICRYTTQPHYPLPEDDPLTNMLQNRTADVFWLYLDVWERHITFIEDDSIREKALNGPDTCTRAKVVWQVKAMRVDAADQPRYGYGSYCGRHLPDLLAISDAELVARVDPDLKQEDACVTPPDSRYRGVENQLYRVEIHAGTPGPPTFKWSRNNASVVAAWLGTMGNDLQVSAGHGFEPGNWVELSDDTLDLRGQPGVLVKVTKVEGDTLTVDPATVPSPDATAWSDRLVAPKVRRWDQRGSESAPLVAGAVPVTESPVTSPTWIDLEDGVQVAFREGVTRSYRPGDYWLIPARVANGEIEWPGEERGRPIAVRPRGIEHHFAPLGFVSWQRNTLSISPCVCEFEPLQRCFESGSIAVGANLLRERIDQPIVVGTRKRARKRARIR